MGWRGRRLCEQKRSGKRGTEREAVHQIVLPSYSFVRLLVAGAKSVDGEEDDAKRVVDGAEVLDLDGVASDCVRSSLQWLQSCSSRSTS